MSATETKKPEIVESAPAKPSDIAIENGKLVALINKAKEKISHDIEIKDRRELVIRNTAELVAVRAIRDQRNHEKIGKTQRLLNKFKSVL
jgi:hypothetical protein